MNKVHAKIATTREQYFKWSFRATIKGEEKFVMKQ